jgi:hypothetical protein
VAELSALHRQARPYRPASSRCARDSGDWLGTETPRQAKKSAKPTAGTALAGWRPWRTTERCEKTEMLIDSCPCPHSIWGWNRLLVRGGPRPSILRRPTTGRDPARTRYRCPAGACAPVRRMSWSARVLGAAPLGRDHRPDCVASDRPDTSDPGRRWEHSAGSGAPLQRLRPLTGRRGGVISARERAAD